MRHSVAPLSSTHQSSLVARAPPPHPDPLPAATRFPPCRFERRIAEPDAFLEDLINVIGGNTTGPHFFLRHLQNGTVNSVTASQCTGVADAQRQARTTTCSATNAATSFELPDPLLEIEGAPCAP